MPAAIRSLFERLPFPAVIPFVFFREDSFFAPALRVLHGRTQLARALIPLGEDGQQLWEDLDYALAPAGLAAMWGWRCRPAKADRQRYQRIVAEVG